MRRTISLLQAVVLLTNLALARRDKNVGFEDADRTYEEVVDALHQGRSITIKQDILESALWACNLLDEQGKFFHPASKRFDIFVRFLLSSNEKFNKDLNYIEAVDVKS